MELRMTLSRSYAALPRSVSDARAALKAWLGALAVDDLIVHDIALALSEACSNVVMHAYRDGGGWGRFRVLAERVDDAVTVTVADDGCGMTPRSDSPGLGLGVPLIAALTDALDVRCGPDGRGTQVWMRFNTEEKT
jgi:anti-sigma regulatory factor (Ser/Thr protein kinase)